MNEFLKGVYSISALSGETIVTLEIGLHLSFNCSCIFTFLSLPCLSLFLVEMTIENNFRLD